MKFIAQIDPEKRSKTPKRNYVLQTDLKGHHCLRGVIPSVQIHHESWRINFLENCKKVFIINARTHFLM